MLPMPPPAGKAYCQSKPTCVGTKGAPSTTSTSTLRRTNPLLMGSSPLSAPSHSLQPPTKPQHHTKLRERATPNPLQSPTPPIPSTPQKDAGAVKAPTPLIRGCCPHPRPADLDHLLLDDGWPGQQQADPQQQAGPPGQPQPHRRPTPGRGHGWEERGKERGRGPKPPLYGRAPAAAAGRGAGRGAGRRPGGGGGGKDRGRAAPTGRSPPGDGRGLYGLRGVLLLLFIFYFLIFFPTYLR